MSKAQDVLTVVFGSSGQWSIEKPRDGRQKECYIASDGVRTVFIKFDVPLLSLQRLSNLGAAPHVLASGTYQGESYVIQEFLSGDYPDRLWIGSHIPEVAKRIRTYHDDTILTEILAGDETRSYRRRLDDELEALEGRVIRYANPSLNVAFKRLKELAQSFGDGRLVPTHNEPNTKNMLVHDGKLTFIDWDEVQLADPIRDIGPLLWWYVPIPQWPDFFETYGEPLTPTVEAKVYWFAARASLSISLLHIEHSDSAGSFYEDFFAALDQRPNPHFI